LQAQIERGRLLKEASVRRIYLTRPNVGDQVEQVGGLIKAQRCRLTEVISAK
jgi:hypothetical protein